MTSPFNLLRPQLGSGCRAAAAPPAQSGRNQPLKRAVWNGRCAALRGATGRSAASSTSKQHAHVNLVLAFALSCFLAGASALAGTNRFTAALISKGESSTNISRATWRPGHEQVSFIRPIAKEKSTNSALCLYDVASGKETILFDPSATTTSGKSNKEPRLSASSYQWSPTGDALLVTGDNDLWLVTVPDGSRRRLTTDTAAEQFPTFSPDGKRVAFVKGADLFVVETRSARVSQLTFDGSESVLNGHLDWVYEEELGFMTGSGRAFEWSPDGKRLAYLQLDQSRVPIYPITDFLRTHPTLRHQHYPKAGDTNARPSMRVVNVTQPRPRPSIMKLPAGTEYVLPEFSWTPDSKHVAVMTLNRAQNELRVSLWNPSRTQPTHLLTETGRCWLNVFDPPRFLKDGRRFLWTSERDGWMHLYLHSRDGAAPAQLTRGPWQIEAQQSQSWSIRPYEIDPGEQFVCFSATERDPRERHVYRVQLDGSGFTPLTHDAGTHFQKLSPAGKHLLTTFSSVDRPPEIRLAQADGKALATLDQRTDRWRDFATATAEFHTLTNADGLTLHAQLTKPPGFDPAKKYPVIVYVYGGPHAQVVRNTWPGVSTRNHLLAQEGCLIWSLDNRGSWGRGRAWETSVYRNLGTNELADQLTGVAYLKTLPFVDAGRLAIWGWSYGGYMTLYTLTHAPDVFRCGIAGAPVTDWKFYDTIYTERYMDTPQENKTGYRTSSPLAYATNLTAKLLLIHGTADDNVHMQNTLNFADALVKAGKPHELQIQPGQMHGFGGEAANTYLNGQILDFFRRNLLK